MTASRQRIPTSMTIEAGIALDREETSTDAAASTDGPPVLLITVGLPGCGKSTFSRRLAPFIDATILESDALRLRLFRRPTYSPAESRRLFAVLHASARALLRRGRNVIIDATSLKESDRRAAYAVAQETGARLLQLNFTTPASVIEERLSRRKAEDASAAGLDVYYRMAAQAEPVNVRGEHLNIDTSDDASFNVALSRVVEACRSRAGRLLEDSVEPKT